METVIIAVKCLIVTYMVYSVGKSAFLESSWQFTKDILKNFSVKMFIVVFFGIILVISSSLVLYEYVPFLRWSWTQYFFDNSINIAFAPTHTGNAVLDKIIGIPFILLLLIAIPKFAYGEEKVFREGTLRHFSILWKSLIFGLIHCVVGIPLSAGFSLVIAGLLYAYIYRYSYIKSMKAKGFYVNDYRSLNLNFSDDEIDALDLEYFKSLEIKASNYSDEANEKALMLATSYHAMWNWLLVLVVLTVLIVS